MNSEEYVVSIDVLSGAIEHRNGRTNSPVASINGTKLAFLGSGPSILIFGNASEEMLSQPITLKVWVLNPGYFDTFTFTATKP